jgi:hypothetical protein
MIEVKKQPDGDFKLTITGEWTQVTYTANRDEITKLRDDIVYEIKKESDQGVRVR